MWIYCLVVISGLKVVGFIVQKSCMGRKWPYLQFIGHVLAGIATIYGLETISGPKVAAFTVLKS